MTLVTRLSRLFTADFHAVLDRIEEPDILLQQALREMEEDLTRNEQGVKQLQHQYATFSARENEVEASLQALDEELDICFDSGEEQLARVTIRRKLETERQSRSIASQQDKTRQLLSEQQKLLAQKRLQLESMRQKAELLGQETPPHTSVAADTNGWMPGQLAISDDEVEVAWLREKQRRNRA